MAIVIGKDKFGKPLEEDMLVALSPDTAKLKNWRIGRVSSEISLLYCPRYPNIMICRPNNQMEIIEEVKTSPAQI